MRRAHKPRACLRVYAQLGRRGGVLLGSIGSGRVGCEAARLGKAWVESKMPFCECFVLGLGTGCWTQRDPLRWSATGLCARHPAGPARVMPVDLSARLSTEVCGVTCVQLEASPAFSVVKQL